LREHWEESNKRCNEWISQNIVRNGGQVQAVWSYLNGLAHHQKINELEIQNIKQELQKKAKYEDTKKKNTSNADNK
jgi:arginine deiminase